MASLLLGVYVFIAFFAIHFHNHGSSEIFKDFQFKKTEKSYTESHSDKDFTDCFSCHISHNSKNLILQDFSISFHEFIIFKQELFAYQQRFSTIQNDVLKLRGPPIFI